MTGSAARGDGSVVVLKKDVNCVEFIRTRTLSCATMMDPVRANGSLPPT